MTSVCRRFRASSQVRLSVSGRPSITREPLTFLKIPHLLASTMGALWGFGTRPTSSSLAP
jgi:hypothetical protein